MFFVKAEKADAIWVGGVAPECVDEFNQAGFGVWETLNDFGELRDGEQPDTELLERISGWGISSLGALELDRVKRGLLPSCVVETAEGCDVRWHAEPGSRGRNYAEIAQGLARRYGGRAVDLTGLVRAWGFLQSTPSKPRHIVRLVHLAHRLYTEEQMLIHCRREGNA